MPAPVKGVIKAVPTLNNPPTIPSQPILPGAHIPAGNPMQSISPMPANIGTPFIPVNIPNINTHIPSIINQDMLSIRLLPINNNAPPLLSTPIDDSIYVPINSHNHPGLTIDTPVKKISTSLVYKHVMQDTRGNKHICIEEIPNSTIGNIHSLASSSTSTVSSFITNVYHKYITTLG